MKELIGRICVKLAGRDAGRKCVVVDVVDKNMLLITGPKKLTRVRRRRVNVSHLAFTPHRIEIREGADDDEVLKKLVEAGLEEYMRRRGEVVWST